LFEVTYKKEKNEGIKTKMNIKNPDAIMRVTKIRRKGKPMREA